ncbi:MAG TPA: outer membrane beta-barrel protein [Candidatus Acidoferrales bacterium]|nr:outer membrane beta-barrel protein [Candidatus Acidoferrales bacterium]
MRRFAPIASVCTVCLFAALAHSQQIDIAVGGGILLASKNPSASEAFLPPVEKGGTYLNVSADVLLRKRIGLNLETSWRDKQAHYDAFETYRPILTDVNALFQPKLSRKFGLDLLAGLGIASNRFYIPGNTACGPGATTCFTSSDHFMEHLSGGLRYYFWHQFFIRPEIHYYRIQNNVEFHSDNLFRASASIGYTFGGH